MIGKPRTTVCLALALALAATQVASAQTSVPPPGSSQDVLAIDLIQACRTEVQVTLQEQTVAYGSSYAEGAALKAKQVLARVAQEHAGLPYSAQVVANEIGSLQNGRLSLPGSAKAYYLCLDRRRERQLGVPPCQIQLQLNAAGNAEAFCQVATTASPPTTNSPPAAASALGGLLGGF